MVSRTMLATISIQVLAWQPRQVELPRLFPRSNNNGKQPSRYLSWQQGQTL
uniref:Uncharacterized protein n=1 Tax=Arundo donax TaxID=35708 RepID=A0A0A9G6D5_ARUDO